MSTARRLARSTLCAGLGALLLGLGGLGGPPLRPGPALAAEGRVALEGGRFYRVHVPERCGAVARPLLVILHGGGQPADDGWDDVRTVADAEGPGDARGCGVVIVYPQAIENVWNFGPELGWPQDDIGWLITVIADVGRRVLLRPGEITVAGFSAGGFLLARALCERRLEWAQAVMLVGATMTTGTLLACQGGQERIPLAIVIGRQDPAVRYDGTAFAPTPHQPAMTALSVEAFWWVMQERRGARFWPEDIGGQPGSDVWRWNSEVYVATVTLADGGHSWPGSAARTDCCGGPISHALDATALLLDLVCSRGGC